MAIDMGTGRMTLPVTGRILRVEILAGGAYEVVP